MRAHAAAREVSGVLERRWRLAGAALGFLLVQKRD